jgi:hypothetical protein
LVYDDAGNRSDEDNDLDFLEEGSHFPSHHGHGHGGHRDRHHSHKMPHVEMVAPATTEDEKKVEKKRK